MYEEETEQEKKSLKDFLTEYFFLFIGGLLILLMRNRWGVVGPWDKSTFVGLGIIAGGFTLKWAWDAWKNATPKFIYSYGYSTTDGELIPAGNFFVHRPAIKAFGMYWKLPGAHVFPMDALRKHGPNIAASSRLDRVNLDELPIVAKSIIIDKGIKEPYYLGFADEEQYIETVDDAKRISGKDKPSVAYLISMLDQTLKENSFLRRLTSSKMKDVEDLVEWSSRLKEKESTWDKAKKTILGEEGKE